MQFSLSHIFWGWLGFFLWLSHPPLPEVQLEIHPFQRQPLWPAHDSSIIPDPIKLFLEYWINPLARQQLWKKEKKKSTFPTKAHTLMSQSVLCIEFTHLLFLSFPGFLLLQFYLLWKKFLHYSVRNKGVQIPKGKDTEEKCQHIIRMNL